MHQAIKEAIEELNQPFLWELQDKTGLPAAALKAHLKDYPKELLISLNEKKVLEVYKEGMTQRQVAELSGLTLVTSHNIIKSLASRGYIEYSNQRQSRSESDKLTFIEVIKDKEITSKGEKVQLKGARGFITEVKHHFTHCIVYKDTIQYKTKLRSNEYRVIGG